MKNRQKGLGGISSGERKEKDEVGSGLPERRM